MKILGHSNSRHNVIYIAEISHTELEQFLDLYYDKLGKLNVGDEVDLAKGREFYLNTMDALAKTEAFISANQKIIDTIFTGISVMGRANAVKTEGAKE